MKDHILPEFQEYLRSKSLVNEKYIPFYAHWASKKRGRQEMREKREKM